MALFEHMAQDPETSSSVSSQKLTPERILIKGIEAVSYTHLTLPTICSV